MKSNLNAFPLYAPPSHFYREPRRKFGRSSSAIRHGLYGDGRGRCESLAGSNLVYWLIVHSTHYSTWHLRHCILCKLSRCNISLGGQSCTLQKCPNKCVIESPECILRFHYIYFSYAPDVSACGNNIVIKSHLKYLVHVFRSRTSVQANNGAYRTFHDVIFFISLLKWPSNTRAKICLFMTSIVEHKSSGH